MDKFVEHPLIKPGSLQSRLYQEQILATAAGSNTLCVLPTGLGKTNISLLLAVERLSKHPKSRVMLLAPTKPLVNQHHDTFIKFLKIEPEEMSIITGESSPATRKKLYSGKIVFATPQTVQNDLKAGRLSLKEFSLLIIDEAHHARGRYAYPFIARRYVKEAEHPRILALTASPGGTTAKIKETRESLMIDAVEIRSDEDADVKPWVKEKRVEWRMVELPEDFLRAKSMLEQAYTERISKLKKMGFLGSIRRVTKRNLLALQTNLRKGINQGYQKAFWGISIVAQAIKLEHALGLLETQGVRISREYFMKLAQEHTKAAKNLLEDRKVYNAMYLVNKLYEQGREHPKKAELSKLVSEELAANPESKIIVFANFRSSVKNIAAMLREVRGAKPVEFLGQREGMTQKEQMKRLQDFRAGSYNVLVSTSIGEEGLDIPAMDLAIFYEPVPSEIRSIQRRGRVGRQKVGRTIILIAKGTRDEAYFWSARHKERSMEKTLRAMKEGEQSTVNGF